MFEPGIKIGHSQRITVTEMQRSRKSVHGIIGWVVYFIGCIIWFNGSLVGLALSTAGIFLLIIDVRRGCQAERIYRGVAMLGGILFVPSFLVIAIAPSLILMRTELLIWPLLFGLFLLIISGILRKNWQSKTQTRLLEDSNKA